MLKGKKGVFIHRMNVKRGISSTDINSFISVSIDASHLSMSELSPLSYGEIWVTQI